MEILDSTKVEQSSAIIDSTRDGFVKPISTKKSKKNDAPPPVIPAKEGPGNLRSEPTPEVMGEKISRSESVKAAKTFTLLLESNMKKFAQDNLQSGNMIFFKYSAKYKELPYDRTPLIFVLKRSKGYTLGINLHWCPIPLRIIFTKLIMKLNSSNIKKNKPIVISYEMVKPLIYKLGLGPTIRLYINSRMSSKGLVVEPEYWMDACKLHAESFTGGYSSDAIYSQAITDFNKRSKQRKKKWY